MEKVIKPTKQEVERLLKILEKEETMYNTKTKKKKKLGTKTQAFGASGRMNHDSSGFYSSKLYEGMLINDKHDETENKIPEEYINKIFCSSSANMRELPDNSVHLMITSPPYNVGKEYDEDLSLEEYKELLKQVLRETYRVLVPGGRACINIANVGRKPYIPLHYFIIEIMHEIGFLMRGEIIWNKGAGAGTSTAWGSWQSASNPILRDVHEYILVFSKTSFSRNKNNKKDTINKGDFLDSTKSIWNLPTVSAKKIGHPAPFPEELPKRLIELYSFERDIILDPFLGSGQTALASIKSHRNYVGYDISKEYCKLALKRIKEETSQKTLF